MSEHTERNFHLHIKCFTRKVFSATLLKYLILLRKVFLDTGFPYLWMNGKKYEFTPEILQAGNKLFNDFKYIQNSLRNIYNRVCDETSVISIGMIKGELSSALEHFDNSWVNYESVR